MAKTALGVIIARGGSKGLVNKNLQPLMGKPLVAWTIEHALASQRLDDVALSSDSEAILDVGRRYGIRVYPRPAQWASDTATVDAAARHGASAWAQEHGRQADYVAILYGNVAIRPPDLIDRAIAHLQETGADSVQSVYPVGKMHPLWMRKLEGSGGDQLVPYQPNQIYRRQDLPPVYMLDAGVLAVTWPSLFTVDPAQPHAFLGQDRRGIVTEPGQVVDIDEDVDLLMAEAILRKRGLTAPAGQAARSRVVA
ncbi:MAG TPA: acylneuraminate cytidylyltransferase family protein [Phycisphaeraceae bacterium]